jgi:hypothetical protein
MQGAFGFSIVVAATLLFVSFEVAGAEPAALRIPANSASGLRLAQASVEQLSRERKRYEAATERARAMLEAEKPAPPGASALPPPARKGRTSGTSDAVCIAGC